MNPLTDISISKQVLGAQSSNINRYNALLTFSFTSTLFLLGMTFSLSGYFSHTNRDFATKIGLFLTGVSTAITIHLIDKRINSSHLQLDAFEGEQSTIQRQNAQISATNYADSLIMNDEFKHTVSLSKDYVDNTVPIDSVNEIAIMEPGSFEEVSQAGRFLSEGKSVVLNATILEPDVAQRVVDFIAGCTHIVNGSQERIGESIFLFTPQRTQIFLSKSTLDSNPKLTLLDFSKRKKANQAQGSMSSEADLAMPNPLPLISDEPGHA